MAVVAVIALVHRIDRIRGPRVEGIRDQRDDGISVHGTRNRMGSLIKGAVGSGIKWATGSGIR